jgi:hypothetical protein
MGPSDQAPFDSNPPLAGFRPPPRTSIRTHQRQVDKPKSPITIFPSFIKRFAGLIKKSTLDLCE